MLPSTYYGRATGIGATLSNLDAGRSARVGVTGLGIGTLAAYARDGDAFRFYEIDPAVVHVARDAGLFYFLEDSRADVEIVVGDARLALAAEQERGDSKDFDVFIVDAFTSDAIPVHLLTREAFVHYADAIGEYGLLALHVSSRHFDLLPLVVRVGLAVGLHALEMDTRQVPRLQSARAQWVVMSRSRERLRVQAELARAYFGNLRLPKQHVYLRTRKPEELLHVPLWTDDYSDLFSVLKAK